jgi:hypothetical protein
MSFVFRSIPHDTDDLNQKRKEKQTSNKQSVSLNHVMNYIIYYKFIQFPMIMRYRMMILVMISVQLARVQ